MKYIQTVTIIVVALFIAFSLLISERAIAQNINGQGNDSIFFAKYELSIDLKGSLKIGDSNKFLFKINNFKNNEINGAYRIGIDFSTNNHIYKITQNNKDYYTTSESNSLYSALTVGYEYQKKIRNFVFLYGSDLVAFVNLQDQKIEIFGDEMEIGASLIPFIGIKKALFNNFSFSIESGMAFSYVSNKSITSKTNSDNKMKTQLLMWKFKTPYSLSINYNF